MGESGIRCIPSLGSSRWLRDLKTHDFRWRATARYYAGYTESYFCLFHVRHDSIFRSRVLTFLLQPVEVSCVTPDVKIFSLRTVRVEFFSLGFQDILLPTPATGWRFY